MFPRKFEIWICDFFQQKNYHRQSLSCQKRCSYLAFKTDEWNNSSILIKKIPHILKIIYLSIFTPFIIFGDISNIISHAPSAKQSSIKSLLFQKEERRKIEKSSVERIFKHVCFKEQILESKHQTSSNFIFEMKSTQEFFSGLKVFRMRRWGKKKTSARKLSGSTIQTSKELFIFNKVLTYKKLRISLRSEWELSIWLKHFSNL